MKSFKEYIKEVANQNPGLIKTKGYIPTGFVPKIVAMKPKKK